MEDENGRYTKYEEEGWSATWGEVASLEDGILFVAPKGEKTSERKLHVTVGIKSPRSKLCDVLYTLGSNQAGKNQSQEQMWSVSLNTVRGLSIPSKKHPSHHRKKEIWIKSTPEFTNDRYERMIMVVNFCISRIRQETDVEQGHR